MGRLSFFFRKSFYLAIALGTLLLGAGIASAGTTPAISSATFKATTSDKILVMFNMPVFATANGTGALNCTDFTFTPAVAGGTFIAADYATATCTHVAGNNWMVIQMANVAGAGDTGAFITPVANNVFTVGGALPNKAVSLTADAGAPTFSTKYKSGADKLLVTFTEPVWTSDMKAGAFSDASTLASTDFAYVDGDAGGATALTVAQNHTGDRTKIQLDLDANLIAGDFDNTGTSDTLDVGAGAVFDIFGNAAAALGAALNRLGAAATSSDAAAPTITSVEAVIGKPNILVNFSEPVFTDFPAGVSAALAAADLAYVDNAAGGKTLSAAAIAHVPGNSWYLITLSANVTASDITTATADTIAAAANGTAIYDFTGNGMVNTPVVLDDTTNPAILTLTLSKVSNQNVLTAVYSEGVTRATGPAANTSQASTATVGDLTTAGTIAGFGAFATPGSVTYATLKNTVALNTAATTYTFTMGAQSLGIRTSTGAQTEFSGIFTPTVAVTDLAPNAANPIAVTSTHATLAGAASWDLTAPSAPTQLQIQGASATNINLAWQAIATTADFARYELYYRQSTSGVTVANGTAWTTTNDPLLATNSTSNTNLTGLNTGFVYYATVAAVDIAGNPALSNEVNVATSSTTSADTTAPATPTAVSAVANSTGVTLLWTDATDLDLSSVQVLRGKNGMPVSGATYASVAKGVRTYTDTDVKAGDTVSYQVRSVDTSNNLGTPSAIVSVTVTAAAATVPAPVVTPVTPVVPPVVAPTTPVVTAPTKPSENVVPPVVTDKKVGTKRVLTNKTAKTSLTLAGAATKLIGLTAPVNMDAAVFVTANGSPSLKGTVIQVIDVGTAEDAAVELAKSAVLKLKLPAGMLNAKKYKYELYYFDPAAKAYTKIYARKLGVNFSANVNKLGGMFVLVKIDLKK